MRSRQNPCAHVKIHALTSRSHEFPAGASSQLKRQQASMPAAFNDLFNLAHASIIDIELFLLFQFLRLTILFSNFFLDCALKNIQTCSHLLVSYYQR